uniref:Uncharacterized protein n=1 Tax=Anopheles albimanus TaxID=7167 RepID=A0A182FE82_ANOAL
GSLLRESETSKRCSIPTVIAANEEKHLTTNVSLPSSLQHCLELHSETMKSTISTAHQSSSFNERIRFNRHQGYERFAPPRTSHHHPARRRHWKLEQNERTNERTSQPSAGEFEEVINRRPASELANQPVRTRQSRSSSAGTESENYLRESPVN